MDPKDSVIMRLDLYFKQIDMYLSYVGLIKRCRLLDEGQSYLVLHSLPLSASFGDIALLLNHTVRPF